MDVDARELLICSSLALLAAVVTGFVVGIAAFVELPWSP